MLLLRLSGVLLLRYAERQFLGLLFQEPPRWSAYPKAIIQATALPMLAFVLKISSKVTMTTELPIIQKTYDLIKWYIPLLNRLPKEHKFQLGDRMVTGLYNLLESLVIARYQKDKLPQLIVLNSKLDVLRYQTRLLIDFDLISHRRYQYVSKLIDAIGIDLGGWIKQQREKGQ